MRLIDRDIFIDDMFDLYLDNRWNVKDTHFSLLDIRSNIDSPKYEVEAIPIWWISKYSRKPLSNADYWAIMRMVTEWEKENETN